MISLQGRHLRRHYSKLNRVYCLQRHYIVYLCIILTLLAGCTKQEPEGTEGKKISPEYIILLGIDTLGAHHLSCYGYPIKTSPFIDAFAQNATVFEQSIAQSSWTLPSFASIFTSLYHHEHKAGLPCDKTKEKKMGVDVSTLADFHVTLAQILRNHGYRTAAFTEGAYLSPLFGLSKGFDLFKVCSKSVFKTDTTLTETIFDKDVKNVVNIALQWIRKNRGQPFFLFLHTYEPHIPLKDPMYSLEEIKREYGRLGFEEQIKKIVQEYRSVVIEKKLNAADVYKWILQERMLYDCEIKYTDYHLGRFFNELKRLGIFDNSLIILTSDHGSEFGEHGEMYHGNNVYQTSIFVPLIIKEPNQKNGRRDNRVMAEGVDIMPTILHMCNVDTESLYMSGSNLFTKNKEKIARAHLFKKEKNLAVGIQEFRKAIFDYDNPNNLSLFFLDQDPIEKKPLFQTIAEKSIFAHIIAPDGLPRPDNATCLDESSQKKEIIDQLKALGYLN